jgi:hypothetical protein
LAVRLRLVPVIVVLPPALPLVETMLTLDVVTAAPPAPIVTV